MTKTKFKTRWEGGKTVDLNEIDDCAREWGLFAAPGAYEANVVLYAVLKAAGVADAEMYRPNNPT